MGMARMCRAMRYAGGERVTKHSRLSCVESFLSALLLAYCTHTIQGCEFWTLRLDGNKGEQISENGISEHEPKSKVIPFPPLVR